MNNSFAFPDNSDFWDIYDKISIDENISTYDLAALIYYLIDANYQSLDEEDKINIDVKRLKAKLLKCINEFFDSLYNTFEQKDKIKRDYFDIWFKEYGSIIIKKYNFDYSVLIFLKDSLYYDLLNFCMIGKICDFTYINKYGYVLNPDAPTERIFIFKENVYNYRMNLDIKIKQQIRYLVKSTKEFNTNVSQDTLRRIRQDLFRINLL